MSTTVSKKSVIIVVVVLIVGVAGGFFGRKIWDGPQPPAAIETQAILDSLMQVNYALQDSIARIVSKSEVAKQEVIRYRTIYDSIYITENTQELLQNLKATANTPIVE